MSRPELVVSEIFGPTFQGEGPYSGRRAAFLRLAGCNLDCRWCDTPYTWDVSRFDLARETERLSWDKIVRHVCSLGVPLLVVTGGEPLLQQNRLAPVLDACHGAGCEIEVETNGTIMPSPAVVGVIRRFNVSPKLANSGVPAARRLRPDVLATLQETGRAIFKFVVRDPHDLEEVAELEARHGLAPIWIMPCGETIQEVVGVMRAVAEPVLGRGWNLTTRLQVLLWGNERGR